MHHVSLDVIGLVPLTSLFLKSLWSAEETPQAFNWFNGFGYKKINNGVGRENFYNNTGYTDFMYCIK